MKKNLLGIGLMAVLCLGMSACSSDDNDSNTVVIDTKVKPSGNWIGTVSSTNCELQFVTERISGKDSSMCTFAIEDVKNDTVYTFSGSVDSFKTPVTKIAFEKTSVGPDSATLKYIGNALNVTFKGGKLKLNSYNLAKNVYNLYTIGGDWGGTNCRAHFVVGAKAYKATVAITADNKTTSYVGTYTYVRNTSQGIFTSKDKKTTMTLSLTLDAKTNVPTLTIVQGKNTYKLSRLMLDAVD